jgi:hypothetical protein
MLPKELTEQEIELLLLEEYEEQLLKEYLDRQEEQVQ